jgi:hypothetical protein
MVSMGIFAGNFTMNNGDSNQFTYAVKLEVDECISIPLMNSN